MIVVGLISGTSADGTEAAVVDIQGTPPALAWTLLHHVHIRHPESLRDDILACVRPEHGTVDRLCALNIRLGEAFAQAALQAIARAGLHVTQVDLIGSHGQTLWHIPSGPNASTLQLGEPAVIAERTGITTISSFRARDMAAGGQGAPLVSFLDVLFLSHPTLTRAAQNIGGIGNVTYLPPAGTGMPFAFDTGPGNMLIDYSASRATQGRWAYDHDGELASQGHVDPELLAELMGEPYLREPPPKTTGRELFGSQFGARLWDRANARGLTDYDIVATATAYTAHSIARAYADFFPQRVDDVVVSGGGAQNPVLMHMLSDLLAPAHVSRSDEFGLGVEAKEAIAFAVLAYETWFHRPGNLPSATGAHHPVIVGQITPGARPIQDLPTASLPVTEARNPATTDIDRLSTLDMLRVMNTEDERVARAVSAELPAIARAVDRIAERMRRGGRLIYLGAGTSGRLGVLDAAECPPTFSTSADQVVALIAGGDAAISRSVEGAEDDRAAGARDIAALNVTPADNVIGIAASGQTPYVIGGMQEAKQRGAFVASLVCSRPSSMEGWAEVSIAPVVGPEVIAGSTRLKAGTAQKMILNMISTGVMIQLGKTYGHWMVDLQATNAKLRGRAQHILEEAGSLSADAAASLLEQCGGEVKTALVSQLAQISPHAARQRLIEAHGSVRAALDSERGA